MLNITFIKKMEKIQLLETQDLQIWSSTPALTPNN
jgi:hypothetical protein